MWLKVQPPRQGMWGFSLMLKTAQISMFLLFFAPPPQVSHSCHRADGAVLLSPGRALLFLGDAGPSGRAAESGGGGEGVLEGYHLQDAHAAPRAGAAAGEGGDGTGVAAPLSSAAAARWKTHTRVFLCLRNGGRRRQKRPRPSRSGEAWRKSDAPSARRKRSWNELR